MAGKISQILAGIHVSAVRHQDLGHIVDVLGEVGARLADLPVPVQHLPLIPVGDGGAVESSLLATESMLSVTPSGKNGGGGPTSGNDTLTGTSNNDTIDGLGGDDTISGLAGDDTLSGSDGNDTVVGGAGADTISGGLGGDILYSDLLSPLINGGTLVLDRGTAVDTITGGDGSDTIFAGYGDNVDGGADGFWGDKLYISFQGATSGIHFDAHLGTQTIGGGTITGIENISWVEGSNYDDYIDVRMNVDNGYSDQTQIYGMGGNDTLIGSWYTAVLDGGDGDDIIDASASSNLRTVNGGAGNDTITTGLLSQAVVNGGDGNDSISAGNEIHGGAGDDTIHVLSDFYHAPVTGDDGNDVITGSESDEHIDGGSGNDTLDGGAGMDVLIGGAGDDILTGGDGNDQFEAGIGNDVITDFSAGDSIIVRGGLAANSVTQVGSDVVIAISSGNQITVQNSDVASVEAAIRFELPKPNDVAISNDGSLIYATGVDGNLYVYSAAHGELLHTWHVGTELGGIAISADGTFAMVTELQPLSSHIDQSNFQNDQFTVTVYKVDLSTGAVTSFPTTVTGDDGAFYDVAMLDGGKVLLSEQNGLGWEGWAPLRVLDLNTGQYSVVSSDVTNKTVLTSDGPIGVGVEPNTSDGPVDLYNAATGSTYHHGLYADGVMGYNYGAEAVSAEAGLVAQAMNTQINIYDTQLNYQFDLTQIDPELGSGGIAALAFDSAGQYLFVLNVEVDAIYQVSTADWSVVAQYNVGANLTSINGDFGNRLLVAPDMSYFTVVTDDGLIKVDAVPWATAGDGSIINGTPYDDTLNGTSGGDTISGFDGSDTIYGNDGNDTIDGGFGRDFIYGGAGDDIIHTGDNGNYLFGEEVWDGPGNDTVYGGGGQDWFYGSSGNDYYDGGTGGAQEFEGDTIAYNDATAGIVVDMRLSANQVYSSGPGDAANVGIDTLVNIEGITASPYDDVIYAAPTGSRFNAGGGNDILYSGPGFDYLNGGDGNDTASYALAAAGVTASLAIAGYQNTGGGGSDAFYSIENLVGSNYADTLAGDGGANSLSGGGGADTLDGAGGADTLDGGVGADILIGGGSNDSLIGGGGNDVLKGGVRDDAMTGGTGSDTYYVDSLADTTVENAGEGQDLVVSSIGWTLGANLENLTLTGTGNIDGTGNDLVNTIVGNSGDNHLNGLGGNDTLNGAAGNDTLDGGLANDSLSGGDGNDTLLGGQGTDTLNGGVGGDWLEGGAARDILTGGTGADQFVFRDGDFGNSQATADKITDFSSVDGDKINLQFVDANTLLGGDQGFSFIGTSAFDGHTAGQLRYEQINGFTFVEGDMDGDGHADMMIRLTGTHTLTGGDFVL